MEFSAWLSRYRKERKLSQRELGEWLNGQKLIEKTIDKSIVANWENGRSLPDYKTFLAISYYAGVADPYAFFLGVKHGYRLNEAGHRKLDDYARLLEESPRYMLETVSPISRQLRFFDIPVSAGHGQFLDGDRCEWRDVDASVPADADYAVWISGDSMEPRFVNKQWIYVKEQSDLESGEIGVFYYDGESYCKVFEIQDDGVPALLSLNPDYEPILVTLLEEFRVFGKVVG